MKVIIVDDELNARENLQYKLSKIQSVTVINEYANPLQALAYVRENPVDIAFLDIEMYEMSGIEMAKRIKEIQPKTNIVFVTGYSEYMKQAFSLHVSGYVLKPVTTDAILKELENLRNPVKLQCKGIRVQCFGNFEIFVDEKPVVFSRAKSKEILAYLVDRKGAGITKKELAAILWEDDEYTRSKQTQLQVFIAGMIKDLKAVQADSIIIRKNLSVDTTKFECDYYSFIKGDVTAINQYNSEYMSNYSWGEFTLGWLHRQN